MRTLLLLTTTLLALATPASAQYQGMYGNPMWNNPISASIDKMFENHIFHKRVVGPWSQAAGGGTSGNTRPAPSAPRPPQGGATPGQAVPGQTKPQGGQQKKPAQAQRFPLTASDFKADGTRRMADHMAGLAPKLEDRAALTKAFREILDRVEAEKDFRRHNMAYAIGLLFAYALQVSRDRFFTDAQIIEIIRDTNDVLGESAPYKSATLRQKQDLYEVSVINIGLIAGLYGDQGPVRTAEDRENRKQAKEMARSVLAIFGLRS